MDFWSILLDIVIVLAGAMVAGGIFARFGHSPLVGYLLAGMLLGGPGSLNIISSEAEIEAVAELGVSLLLFGLGLEFSWNRLSSFGYRALIAGVLQVAITLLVAALLFYIVGFGVSESVAVGAIVSVSSTACVLRVLLEQGQIDSAYGRNSIAILLMQDIAIVPLAILLTVLGGDVKDGTAILLHVGQILLFAAGLVAVLYVLVNKLAVLLLGVFTLERNRELGVLLAIGIGLGSTWGAHHVGISPALGPFIAGMFLGSSPFASQVRGDISALRVILLTLFFGAVGMIANPIWMLDNFGLVIGTTVCLIIGKGAIIWAILRFLGHSKTLSLLSAMCLAQVGEFAFVLADIAKSGSILSERIYMLIISSAILTLFVTPYLVAYAPRFSLWLARLGRGGGGSAEEEEISATELISPEILIIGFGPAGQIAAEGLSACRDKVLVIDLNNKARLAAGKFGFRTAVGDAVELQILEHSSIQNVRVVIITIPDKWAALTALRHLKRLAPKAKLVVRSRHERDVPEFIRVGADVVVGDETEVGNRLATKVLALVSLPEEEGADIESAGHAPVC